MSMGQWRNDGYQEKTEVTTRNLCSSGTSSVMNVTWCNLGRTSTPRDKKSASKMLNYGREVNK
jgi:hypothetical protein